MKKEAVRCPKCGKEYTFTLQNIGREIECSHCHKKMIINKKSKIMLYAVNYFVAFALCAIVTGVMSLLGMVVNYYVNLAIILICVLVLVSQEKYSLWIEYNLFGLTYEEVKPEENNAKKKK